MRISTYAEIWFYTYDGWLVWHKNATYLYLQHPSVQPFSPAFVLPWLVVDLWLIDVLRQDLLWGFGWRITNSMVSYLREFGRSPFLSCWWAGAGPGRGVYLRSGGVVDGSWVVSGIPYLAQRKINLFVTNGRTIITIPQYPLWSFLINMKTDCISILSAILWDMLH